MVLFVAMFFFTACHVGVRLLGVALLAVVSPVITAAVLGGDMIFFLLFKLARNDLRYWINASGSMSLVMSFLFRFFTKMIADFTVMVHMRHPLELGGLYWILCLILGQATSFVAVYLYTKRSLAGEVESEQLPSDKLWALIGVLEMSFVIFFVVFVAAMNAQYRSTFFSTVTGKQFFCAKFRGAMNDEAKIDIIWCHPALYADFKDEVKLWILENYARWIEEEPEWFNARVRKAIPEEMVPVDEVEVKVTRERNKDRISVFVLG